MDLHDNEYSGGYDDTDDDDSGPPWMMIYILGAVVGIWCCAMAISTKGCRDCRHRDRYYYQDDVWVVPPSSTVLRDRRLAVQLQREESEAARRQATLRREQIVEERKLWIKRALEDQHPFHLTSDNITEHPICAICLIDLNLQSDVLQGTLCTHVFHKDCISAALVQSSHCPVCRQVFLQEEIDAETTNRNITTEEHNQNNAESASLEFSNNSRDEDSLNDASS
jgi:hypothetical protein